MKFYNIITALFFVIYGLYGAFVPAQMADLMGFDVALLGTHQIRALWMAMFGAGIIILRASQRSQDQEPILKATIFLMLAFAAGRCLGLVFDGTGPVQTYYELSFELIWAALGFGLYRRVR